MEWKHPTKLLLPFRQERSQQSAAQSKMHVSLTWIRNVDFGEGRKGPDLTKIPASWRINQVRLQDDPIKRIRTTHPDLVAVEIFPPISLAIRLIKQLRALVPPLPIVPVAVESTARAAVLCLLAGATGFLILPLPPEQISKLLVKAKWGLPALCDRAQIELMSSLRRTGDITYPNLTQREMEILAYLSAYCPDKEIAHSLGICPGTVHVHVAKLFKKLGVHTRSQAVAKFFESI